jgi:hypothetical protein
MTRTPPRASLRVLFAAVLLSCALASAPEVWARIVDDLPAVPPPTSENPAPAPPTDSKAGGRPNGVRPAAVPEVRGPGRVTNTSRVWLKATNIGIMGNAFPTLSNDPSAQWPGPSGVEYLFYWGLWVGAAIPGATSPNEHYRVSQSIEWRPPTLEPEDRIYTSYDGAPNGLREFDDDGDGRTDEDFQNGRDDDGDGLIDEDFAAASQRMFSFEMRDDTEQARNATPSEPHVPLGLQVRQTVLAFEGKEAQDFVGTTYEIRNVSDHDLDSVYVGFMVDQDVGPVAQDGYWRDDIPEPRIPSATYQEQLTSADPRYDARTDPTHANGFCKSTSYKVRGFTMTDDDADGGRTPGASCFLLLDHTVDASGTNAPEEVGFRTFRLYRPGVAFAQGGPPTLDLERYQAMSIPSGVVGGRPALARPSDAERADWSTLVSVGPFRKIAAGQSVSVTVALGVWPLDLDEPVDIPGRPGVVNPKRYKAVVDGANAAYLLYRGRFEIPPPGTPTPFENGRETFVTAPPGKPAFINDCHFNPDSTGAPKELQPGESSWFNFNCDYCDAVKGKLPRHWLVPPSPLRPALRITPGDHRALLEWDNASEVIPERPHTGTDPSAGAYRFWGYRVYRAAGYTRPVGTSGPVDAQWELIANLRRFDTLEPLIDSLDVNGDGVFDSTTAVENVLLDIETNARYQAQPVPPVLDPDTGLPVTVSGTRTYRNRFCHCDQTTTTSVTQYPVGRYRLSDLDVLNGFLYFYTVTAVDSSGAAGVDGTNGSLLMREGRRYAVEGEGVTPHDSTAALAKGGVIVVPNPYRGSAAWDLSPNPSDPTGTHVDFLHMPQGTWTLKIFTISGDLVQTIHNDDAQANGRLQQESPTDGQASWNLLSRNGQDVASGIYLFAVTSAEGTVRGKFVIIR